MFVDFCIILKEQMSFNGIDILSLPFVKYCLVCLGL